MKTKLYIGGLSWDTTADSLRSAFERFGSIAEVILVSDRETGRSRGFGFVTFTDGSVASTAMSSMNGATLDGRSIIVNEAREREAKGSGGGRYR